MNLAFSPGPLHSFAGQPDLSGIAVQGAALEVRDKVRHPRFEIGHGHKGRNVNGDAAMADRVGLVRSVRLVAGRDIAQESGAAQHARQRFNQNGQTCTLMAADRHRGPAADDGPRVVGGPAVPVEAPNIPGNPLTFPDPLPHPAPRGGHARVEQDGEAAGCRNAKPHRRVADHRAAGAGISHGSLGVRKRHADHARVGRFQAIRYGGEKVVVTYDQRDADATLPGLGDRKPHPLHAADDPHAVVAFYNGGHATLAQDGLVRIGPESSHRPTPED